MELLTTVLYPVLFRIDTLTAEIGQLDVFGKIVMPKRLRVLFDSLSDAGVYLIENGFVMTLWIGKNASAEVLGQIFGVHSFQDLDARLGVPSVTSPLSLQLQSIIAELRRQRHRYIPLQVSKQSDPMSVQFNRSFVEEKTEDGWSYVQFVIDVHNMVKHEMS